MRSLHHLMLEPRAPDSEVARCWDPETRCDRTFLWRDFQHHVSALVHRIQDHPPGPFVLLTEDAYAFAVGLLALLHDGRHGILPPNRQAGALHHLEAGAVGFVSDQPDWFEQADAIHPLTEVAPGAVPKLGPLDPAAACVELFTSGTTGESKSTRKTIAHLEDEVRQLAATWDTRVRGARVFATASHQHLYGLLFGVLWPLLTQRCFQSRHFLHPGELVPRMREASASVLVGVPTHLKRLARHADLDELRDSCRVVFSSGGPLATETAHTIAERLGHPPLEVLGSTETGGIAWRGQEIGEDKTPWTPFSAVDVARDASGMLRVRSPFVSEPYGAQGYATGDRISFLPGGGFLLEGRGDRIVKIGEKRLDLEKMEAWLRDRPGVSEVALVPLERESELRVAAAVVPSEAGWERIEREDRRAFRDALRADLQQEWDPILHPRSWRIVSRLPENAQGKITQESLLALFRSAHPSASLGDRPEVLGELRGADFLEQECRVPSDLACLPGHFPGHPVVPGVLQLDWVLDLASDLLDAPIVVEHIESLKLSQPLYPEALFRIRVSLRGDDRLDFRVFAGEDDHARGRVRLAAEPGAPA